MVSVVFLMGCQPTIDDPEPEPEVIANPIDSVSQDVVTRWVNLQDELLVQTPAFVAPISARVLAYTYLSLYESLVPAMPGFQSLAGQLNGLSSLPQPEEGRTYHWPTVANVAQYSILAELFVPVNTGTKAPLDSLRRTIEQEYVQQIPNDVLERSIRHGAAVGGAIWQYARQDGGGSAWSNLYPNTFTPTVGPSFWRSTSSQPRPLLPQWREVRPFLEANANLLMANPPVFSSRNDSPFFAEAKQVYDRSRALSPAQQLNINRWVEGSETFGNPVAMTRHFTNLAVDRKLTTSQLVVGLVRLALAGHDAYVQSWKAKYQHQRVRPQSYLQETLDPTWIPSVADNNTPEYGSSWVTYMSAWSEIVKASLGSTGTFNLGNGLSYTDLNALLTDVSNAQLDAGLHFPSTLSASQIHGSAIGKKINELSFRKP